MKACIRNSFDKSDIKRDVLTWLVRCCNVFEKNITTGFCLTENILMNGRKLVRKKYKRTEDRQNL